MKKEELERRESALSEAGYHTNRNTSSINEYSWFKTVRDPDDPEEWLYMTEWRVWDWRKYADYDPYCAQRPYSMELCILVNLPEDATARMIYPDTLSIEQAESLAKDLYQLTNRHNHGNN